MKNQLSGIIDNLISFILFAIAGLTPILFFNQTTEFFEIPKLIFLITATLILTGLWIFSWVLKGKVEITRTPFDIPLLILAVAVVASTFLSASRFPAIYGNIPRVHGSAASMLTYILLYFVAVSNLKSTNIIKSFLYVLYGSGAIVSIIGIFSFFGIFLPFDFAKSVNFSPTGSTFSSIALLLLLLPLPLLSILKHNRFLPLPLALFLSILFCITIALTGSITIYILLIILLSFCFLILKPLQHKNLRNRIPLFLIPVFLVGVTLALTYLPIPGNAIQKLGSNFPREIQLPLSMSWKISASAFIDSPYVGTGPSTFLFNFTSYKPLEFNNLPYWNFPFDTAHNEFLQVLSTLGALGMIALLALCLIIIAASRRVLIANKEEETEDNHLIGIGLAVSGIVSVLLFAIHSTTLVSLVLTMLILAALMGSQKSIRDRKFQFSMGLKTANADGRNFDLIPVIIFVVFLVGAIPALVNTYSAAAADYYHRQSLLQASKSGNKTYEMLQKAEKLNPYIDLYRVDMAQTNFALANAIAVQKGPTEANPQGTLTDEDRKTIQTLISQAINEGRIAVALSPLSHRNWEVLASIYRNITGIAQNANTFALDAYGRAIQRDPLNPALRLNVGGVYYSIKNYDLAIRFYTDAANLKPDYANAYFNLAIALRDKGDLQNAKLVADQTLNLLSKNKTSNDYKIAEALVKDLSNKILTNTGTNTSANPLENTNVNLDNLNNPPNVSTPAAIRQNPNSNLPRISPTPAK